MRDSRSQKNRSRPKRKGRSIAAGCILVPVLLILCVYTTYRLNNRTPSITLPPHPMPVDNAREYFERAYVLTTSMQHKTPYDMATSVAVSHTVANFKGCATDAEPALKMMRDGFNHPFMNSAVRSASGAYLPQLSHYRELARVNSGAAGYYELSGDPVRAMDMYLDGVQFGLMIPRGGGLIPWLVGIACESIAEARIEDVLVRLSPAELEHVAIRLEALQKLRVPYADILEEEAAGDIAIDLEFLGKSEKSRFNDAMDLAGGSEEDEKTSLKEKAQHQYAVVRFMLRDKASMLKDNQAWMHRLVENARQPYTGPVNIPVPDNLLAESTFGDTETARQKFASSEAKMDVLRVETALLRYHAAHGTYPPTLVALNPAYLQEIPLDACGARPLHYSVKDGGKSFLLYSVGPDLADDHGNPGKFAGAIPGDIVAGRISKVGPLVPGMVGH